MNKLFLENYMHTAPKGTEQKYIFLTDDREIGFNIIAAGYKAVLILEQENGYYDVDSFAAYMDEIMLTGTYQSEYCYIPACSEKKINDILEQYFNLNRFHKFNEQGKRIG